MCQGDFVGQYGDTHLVYGKRINKLQQYKKTDMDYRMNVELQTPLKTPKATEETRRCFFLRCTLLRDSHELKMSMLQF